MKLKRLISLFITVMLVVGSIATVSAASFPDLESRHSWAEDAIDDMVSRGILKGYTDGTFKPDKAVTHLETLIIASRIMGVDESQNSEYREVAVKQYSSVLSAYDIDFKDEVAYLLYCGVLTSDELSNYISNNTKNQPLKRYEAAVLLTKLVGGEKTALANSVLVLDFDDAGSIPSSAKAYVKYVADAGIMNGVDDDNFSPNGELTRAMISAVMYRAESYMNESTVEGTVESKGNESITISVKGVAKNIQLPEDVTIKVDGKSVSVSDLSVGQYVRVHCVGKNIRFIDAVTSNLYQTVTGIISATSEISGTKKVSIKNSTGTQSYTISPEACKYLVNGQISTYLDIDNGMYAVMTIQGGYVTEISVETGSKKYTGKIAGITINADVVSVTIALTDGTEMDFIFNDGSTITRNGSKADVNALAIGDSVNVTITNGGISTLNASSSSKTVSGVISKIVISSNPEITIKTSTDEKVYGVTTATTFKVDGKTDCTIYDLRLGAAADLRLDSTNITSISTQSTVATPTMTGVVSYIHPTSYVMGLQVVDAATGAINNVQTVVKSNVKITDTTSSGVYSFKNIEPGMTVVVVGTSNYGVYEVTQIIVTAKVN
ncbi:MAG: S-layer homology domain-containing protein [Clostridia bacterium]|nr:S-layer homology domain-containing protein [Clostridia bacterium]